MLGLGTVWEYFDSPVAYVVQGFVGALMLLYVAFAPDSAAGKKRSARVPRSQQSLGSIFLLRLTI